jgi:hypothetical protein
MLALKNQPFHHPRTHATAISISKSTSSAHKTIFKYSRLTGKPSPQKAIFYIAIGLVQQTVQIVDRFALTI